MRLAVIADSHENSLALQHVAKHLIAEYGVEQFIHCGDIEEPDLNAKFFGNLPVTLALTEDQVSNTRFLHAIPPNWQITKPGSRVVHLWDKGIPFKIYVGHRRSLDADRDTSYKLEEVIDLIHEQNDCIRIVASGHVHHAIYEEGHDVGFLNPGAVTRPYTADGYEWAVVDTVTRTVIFGRIPKEPKATIKPFSVGVISDSLNISGLNPDFWRKLACELRGRGVKHLIHCGNISLPDIGMKEFSDPDFEVYYTLVGKQENPKNVPSNWRLISPKEPIVEINNFQFYVEWALGALFLSKTGYGINEYCVDIKTKFPGIGYILGGVTAQARYYESPTSVRFIDPGDVTSRQNFVIITLPHAKITFSKISSAPLPPI